MEEKPWFGLLVGDRSLQIICHSSFARSMTCQADRDKMRGTFSRKTTMHLWALKRISNRLSLFASFSLLLCPAFLGGEGRVHAQQPIPYSKTPSWQGSTGAYSTGGAFVDLNRDGWPDYVSADGNDMARQNLRVWYNNKGSFSKKADWLSQDVDYHGHLDVGDVNGDGWPDVVVSVFLGPKRFSSKGWVKLYLNDGQGKLGLLPAWRSKDSFFSFACALGDMDADGDLDLAVASGESYQNPKDRDRIYRNDGGTFTSLPVWTSGTPSHSMDVAWCDVDGDGDLDLAFTGSRGPNTLYLNQGGTFGTSPSWSSTDGGARHNGNSIAFGDVDGDGLPDLAVSDNRQLGGRGTFRVYHNLGKGKFSTTPWWESRYFANGYVSGLAFVDFDRDGDLDLVGGGWWAPTAIFENLGKGLATSPRWQTTGTSVVEAIFVSDVDGDGLRKVKGESHPPASGKRILKLGKESIVRLDRVVADGKILGPGGYCFHRETGTLSLKTWPKTSLKIDYQYTDAPDLGVTNWDRGKGNFCFLREHPFWIRISPPSQQSFKPGSLIAWQERLELTTANSQLLIYSAELDFPRQLGTWKILTLPLLLPGYTKIPNLPWGLLVPKPLSPTFLGLYQYRVRLLDGNAAEVSVAKFGFRLVP
jgi:hypothetical protein